MVDGQWWALVQVVGRVGWAESTVAASRGVGGSGGVAVFVDESDAGGAAMDRLAWPSRADDVVGVIGGSLVQSAVWPVLVVVIGLLDEQRVESTFVPDDRAVEDVSQGANPPLCERVRLGCSGRDPDHNYSRRREHIIE